MPTYTIKTPDGRTVKIKAADQQTAVNGAREWASANPKQDKSFLGDIAGTIGGAVDQYAQNLQKRATRPMPRSIGEAVGSVLNPYDEIQQLGDAANVALSPIAGLQHAVLRPASEALVKAGVRPPKMVDRVMGIGGRPEVSTSAEQAQMIEGDLGMALSAATPAKGVRVPTRAPSGPPKLSQVEKRAAQIVKKYVDPQAVSARTQAQLPLEATPQTTRLARAVVANPTPAAARVEEAITAQRASMPSRMLQEVETATGGAGGQFYPTMEALDQSRKAAAAPLYEQAYAAQQMRSPELVGLLDRPSVKTALGKAVRIAREEGVNPADIGFGPQGEVISPTPQVWDYIKRGLDDVLDGYRDPTSGRMVLDTEGRSVLQTQNALKDAMRAANPDLGAAWDAYAGPSRQIEALQRGRKLVGGNIDPETIIQGTGRLSADELSAQRLGMARGLADRIRGGNPRAVNRALSQNELLRSRITAGLDSPEAAQGLFNAAENAAQAETKYQSILGGSRTTPLAQDIQAFNAAGDADLLDNAIGIAQKRLGGQSFRNQVGEAFVSALDRLRIPALQDPQVADILADVLIGVRTPEEVISLLENARVINQFDAWQLRQVFPALQASSFPPRLSAPSYATGAAAEEGQDQ